MSGSKRDHGPIVVGGEPRIDFLPTETKKRKENRRQRRSFVALVIIVAIACGLGYYSSTALAVASQDALEAERLRTKELLAEQSQYAEAAAAVSELRTVKNAQLVGSSTEIIWADYLAKVRSALPPEASFVEYAVDGLSSIETLPLVNVLLQRPRVATITFVFATPTVQVADAVLVSLQGQPFYADSTISLVDWDTEHQYYAVTSTIHITSEAFAGRFAEAAETDDDSTETDEPATGTEG